MSLTTITASGKDASGNKHELSADYALPLDIDSVLTSVSDDVIVHAVCAYLRSQIQAVIRRTIAAGRMDEVQELVSAWKPGEVVRVSTDPKVSFQKYLDTLPKDRAAQLLADFKASLKSE